MADETPERPVATLEEGGELGFYSGDTPPGIAEYMVGITVLGLVLGSMLAAVGAIWGMATVASAYPAVAFTAAGGLLFGGFGGLVAASATTRMRRRAFALGAAGLFGPPIVFAGVVGLLVWIVRLA